MRSMRNSIGKGTTNGLHQQKANLQTIPQRTNEGLRKTMNPDKEFDIVIDALATRRDALWAMTKANMEHDMFNVMDQIRLEQIDQLDKAIHTYEESQNR